MVTKQLIVGCVSAADDALEIEVFLKNNNVGLVRAEQPAETKLETFPLTKVCTSAESHGTPPNVSKTSRGYSGKITATIDIQKT